MPDESHPRHRPRRLRLSSALRGSLASIRLHRRDLIVPVFVREGKGVRKEIASMPGVFQMSVDLAADWLAAQRVKGLRLIWSSG